MSDLSTYIGFAIAFVIYLLLMKWWVIPKYQPFLRGGLRYGYSNDSLDSIFSSDKKRKIPSPGSSDSTKLETPKSSENNNLKEEGNYNA